MSKGSWQQRNIDVDKGRKRGPGGADYDVEVEKPFTLPRNCKLCAT